MAGAGNSGAPAWRSGTGALQHAPAGGSDTAVLQPDTVALQHAAASLRHRACPDSSAADPARRFSSCLA